MTVSIPTALASQMGLLTPGDEAYLQLRSFSQGEAVVEVESDESEETPGETVPETSGELTGPAAGEVAGPLPIALKRALGA